MLWYLLLALFLDCIGRGRSIRLSKIQLTWAILRFTYCLFLLIKVLNYNLHNIPVQIIKNHKNDRIMNCAIYWFLIFFSISIGPYIPLRQTSFRLAAGVWCLMSLVLINAYSGNLISYLSVPKLKPVLWKKWGSEISTKTFLFSFCFDKIMYIIVQIYSCYLRYQFKSNNSSA